jgi:hypothetical protein
MIVRKYSGLLFEVETPSIWYLVGAPVMLAYTGRDWAVSLTDRDGRFREGFYPTRDAALSMVARAYSAMEANQ